MSDYFSAQNHRSMVFDELRNNFYYRAIKSVINDDSIVLDLGCGLGLLGFMAVLRGAKKTYLVDPSPVMKITNKIAEVNNFSEKVTCIENKIQEIDLPEKVDVIISTLTGNFLLTEDLLSTLFYARDNYLRPGGKLIPDRARMEVVPVYAPEYYDKHIADWADPLHKIDFSQIRQFAINNIYYDKPESMKSIFLSDPAQLLDLDFMTANEASCRDQIKVNIKKDGLCHGWLGWFQIHLGDKWLSTSPIKKQTHWRQVFLPLAQPIQVKAGENMSFELNRPEFGEWTWTVETADIRQRQSTFLSEPLTTETLLKKSDNYNPILNNKGHAAREILQKINGEESISMIAKAITESYPHLFPNQEHTRRFIIKFIEDFC